MIFILVCVPDENEIAQIWYRGSLNYDCGRMESKLQACTTKKEIYHTNVMEKCPATCANARGESCPGIG